MSFRRVQNAKDKWAGYCHKQRALVEATGLPGELFRKDDLLQKFLRVGVFQTAAKKYSLSELPDEAFVALERFIEPVFDFQHSYPALAAERLRRFQRYG
jgi:hypothetical protein